MPKFFVNKEKKINDKIYIDGIDVNHIKNVLRIGINDNIEICIIEEKKNYLCKISKVANEEICCEIIEKLDTIAEANIKITLFQALPKSDKMELIIQKTTELGVYNIVPISMNRCVVKLDSKTEGKKIRKMANNF